VRSQCRVGAAAVPGRYRLHRGQPQQKIHPEYLDRAAIVYVRQPGRQQVLEHSEPTRLQYAPAEQAVAPGWARSQVTGPSKPYE
jgi:hypothetical protein